MNKPDISKLPSLNELRAGNDRAWDDLYTSFDGMIRAIVAWPKWRFDAHTCEDVAQTIRVGIFQSVGRLQAEKSLISFVRKICINRCVDMLRKKLREQNRLIPLGRWNEDGEWEDIDVKAGDAFDPVTAMQQTERAALLRAALAQLDEASRACVLQFYVEGLSYKEMAQRQGVTVNTVGSRLSRCLEKLRKILGQTEED